MNIEGLGPLTVHQEIEEWIVSQPVHLLLLGIELPVVLDGVRDDESPEEFARAVQNFLKLSPIDRDVATPYVYKNYREFIEAIGQDEVNVRIESPSAVWAHVRPTGIYVRRRGYGDNKVYVLVEPNCDWEVEHGLQLVYREGLNLTRVSAFDGHVTYCDAYDLPESEDRIC